MKNHVAGHRPGGFQRLSTCQQPSGFPMLPRACLVDAGVPAREMLTGIVFDM
ncbi:hypothetical protein [Cupriavidus sp. CP313]